MIPSVARLLNFFNECSLLTVDLTASSTRSSCFSLPEATNMTPSEKQQRCQAAVTEPDIIQTQRDTHILSLMNEKEDKVHPFRSPN